MSNSLGSYGLGPTRLLCPWDSPDKDNGVGCHALLQEIFLPQGSNPYLLCLLHCRWKFFTAEPPGKPTCLSLFWKINQQGHCKPLVWLYLPTCYGLYVNSKSNTQILNGLNHFIFQKVMYPQFLYQLRESRIILNVAHTGSLSYTVEPVLGFLKLIHCVTTFLLACLDFQCYIWFQAQSWCLREFWNSSFECYRDIQSLLILLTSHISLKKIYHHYLMDKEIGI